jgi:hypothetical protein
MLKPLRYLAPVLSTKRGNKPGELQITPQTTPTP